MFALVSIERSKIRVINELEEDYLPTHQLRVDVLAGDILRVAGFLEVSEQAQRPALVTTFLGVRRAQGQNTPVTRISPFTGQLALRGTNHHMPLNSYGTYRAQRAESVEVEMLARVRPLEEEHPVVLVEDRLQVLGKENDRGGLVVEHYRPTQGPAEALSANLSLLVGFDRQIGLPDDIELVRGVGMGPLTRDLPATRGFQLKAGDFLRLYGAATATLDGTDNQVDLMTLLLRVRSDSRDTRQTVATENLTEMLTRTTLQADGVHRALRDELATPYQQTQAVVEGRRHFYQAGSNADLAALHFSRRPGRMLVETKRVPLPSDVSYDAFFVPKELVVLTAQGTHRPGDIIRVNSGLWAEIESNSRRVGCAIQVRLFVEGALVARSIWDQRHLRKTSEQKLSHPWGAFAPFLVHESASGGVHRVDLVFRGKIGEGGPPVTLKLKSEGTELIVDTFGLSTSQQPG